MFSRGLTIELADEGRGKIDRSVGESMRETKTEGKDRDGLIRQGSMEGWMPQSMAWMDWFVLFVLGEPEPTGD